MRPFIADGEGERPRNAQNRSGCARLTCATPLPIRRRSPSKTAPPKKSHAMKVRSSLKTLKTRHRDCKLVRRRGRLYVINKTNPRYKARQG